MAFIFLIIGCSEDCPDQNPCPELPEIDSAAICDLCMDNYQMSALHFWDSVRTVRLLEVTQYYNESKSELDSFEAALLNQQIYLDSIKDVHIYDNMLIYHEGEAEAFFDEETGKPKLVLK